MFPVLDSHALGAAMNVVFGTGPQPACAESREDIIRGKFEARLAAALGLSIYPAAEAKNLDDLLEIVEYRTFLCAQED